MARFLCFCWIFFLTDGFLCPKAAAKSRKQGRRLSLFRSKNLSPKILELALRAYKKVSRRYSLRRRRLTIIDFTKPSSQKRLWVLDMKKRTILFYEWVAHGKNSGLSKVVSFSNRNGSKQSSIGVYLTGNTYIGKHGLSLKLRGLEKGFNHHAMKRAIVMHGAWYVSRAFLRKHGRLGRSWGCPAVRKKIAKPLMKAIRRGSVLFVYGRTKNWLHSSTFLR